MNPLTIASSPISAMNPFTILDMTNSRLASSCSYSSSVCGGGRRGSNIARTTAVSVNPAFFSFLNTFLESDDDGFLDSTEEEEDLTASFWIGDVAVDMISIY